MSFARITGAAVVLAAVCGLAAPATAAQLLESYDARLSTADHFNSNGERLTSPAAIIRQDRANFHKFHVRDREDQNDGYFARAENRALMERLLEAGRTPREARDAIVDGTPMIHVEVWRGDGRDWVEVSIY